MANPEHLAILKQGVPVWNKYREEQDRRYSSEAVTRYQLYRPDFTNANLSGLDLSSANLERAILRNADLRAAKLSFATFNSADLTTADLSQCECMGTLFNGAYLVRANLQKASLLAVAFSVTHVDILGRGSISLFLYGPELSQATFADATMGHCTFSRTDLSRVKGLTTVHHVSPSSIDVMTMYLSKGKIPDRFLRGCGLPESIGSFQRTVRSQRMGFHSSFISHSSRDQKFADRLYAGLQAKGIRCFLATEDLKIGEWFRQRIDESIGSHDKLLLILSEHSVRSSWVAEEVESALEREHHEKRSILFPIRIDEAVMGTDTAWAAAVRRTRHIGDFSNWKNHDSYQKAFQRLLRDLKAEQRDSA
jgi:TIR domain/Pentapeptide repeats (8 copies)